MHTAEGDSGLRIGVLLPTRQGTGFDAAPLATALELAEQAEALGLDSVFAGESILARPRHDPYTVLGAVAARTERIALGTSVALVALHPPLLLAQRLATLDALSGGRLVVGAGLGIDHPGTRAEFAAAGVPFEERVGRLVATVQACRALLGAGDAAQADDAPGRRTKYWDLRGVALATRPARPGGPPFWVGSTLARERALERAGRVFDGWIPTAPSAEAYGAGWKGVRSAAVAAGRAPAALTPAVYLTVSLARDAAGAEAALRAYIEPYYQVPFDVMRRVQGMFAGTAADCAEWLAGYARAGVRHFVLRTPDLASHLEPLAREVAPRLRELGSRTA